MTTAALTPRDLTQVGRVSPGVGRCHLAEYFGDVEGSSDETTCQAFTNLETAKTWVVEQWYSQVGPEVLHWYSAQGVWLAGCVE